MAQFRGNVKSGEMSRWQKMREYPNECSNLVIGIVMMFFWSFIAWLYFGASQKMLFACYVLLAFFEFSKAIVGFNTLLKKTKNIK